MIQELQADLNFDGPTIEPALDRERLMGQLAHVLALMIDGKWRTLSEIAGDRYSQAGVSARLRDLRKVKFGAYTVDRRRCGAEKSGLFQYRVTKGQQDAAAATSRDVSGRKRITGLIARLRVALR